MTEFKELLDKAIRLKKEEQFKPALEILENLFEKNPQSEDIKKHLINMLFDYGSHLCDDWTPQYDKASKYFKRIIDLDQNNYRAWYNLGITHFNLNQTEQALNSYNEALKIKPDYAYCYYNMGLVYESNKNDLEKALEYYEKALSYNANLMYALQAKRLIRQKLDISPENDLEKEQIHNETEIYHGNKKLCNNCGNYNRYDAKFCDKCGNEL